MNSLLGAIPGTIFTGSTVGANALAGTSPLQWIHVIPRFQALLGNLNITDAQLQDGTTKHSNVRACLNRNYYGVSSETANSLLIGSWGKHTRVRPSRDVDLIFLLPDEVFHRYQQRTGNIQSQLLQEVKNVLLQTFPQTDMRGDGQVVVIPFTTTPVEVAPGFLCQDGSILVCDTNNGGRYMFSTAQAELQALNDADQRYAGNARPLARMFKQWQRHCNVPLKSFQIERLAADFLSIYSHAQQGLFYYDWFCRDFLAYIISRANSSIVMPGTGEWIWLGDDWLSRAKTAYAAAVKACEYERANENVLAGLYWQDIFGAHIPSQV